MQLGLAKLRWLTGLALVTLLTGCTSLWQAREESRYVSSDSRVDSRLSEQTLAWNASAAALPVRRAVLLTDNDDAFAAKLELIDSARETIDLAYYIFADDYSSSSLTVALIEAAKRGVQVRLLLDYHSNYSRLDWFSMMEWRGSSGKGSLEVRFFNRPSKNIVKDAVYLTLGCSESVDPDPSRCSTEKYAKIDAQFAEETIDGRSVAELNLSNLNIGGSGLFLSGLYGKNPQLMALAISEGQGIEPERLLASSSAEPQDMGQLKQLGEIYLKANYGSGLERAVAQVKLSAAGLLYGEQLDPLQGTLASYLPVERGERTDAARRDWRYLTEYLHHKLLLADQRELVLGGRNIEDAYHMVANSLTSKYVFRDTDIRVSLKEPVADLRASFDRLWDFDLMVARLDEVRRHAPNEFLVASQAASAACAPAQARGKAEHEACRDAAFSAAGQHDLETRMAAERKKMLANARVFRAQYRPRKAERRSPRFSLDNAADVFYTENVPLRSIPGSNNGERGYGAQNGLEGDSGKHIHALWLAALQEVCTLATQGQPQRVILHNAYLFPPANLLGRLARMIDGTEDCGGVRITVLTNSIETTDLNVVNIAARHQIKAFAEFARTVYDPQRSARFEYFEYRPPAEGGRSQVSLHSKVFVIGPYLYVGSANADVRSFMMDTNNGLLIREAPQLIADYEQWVQSLLDDPRLTVDRTDYFIETSRSAMLEEDRQTLRAILAKYRAERWIRDEEQQRTLEETVVRILDEIYSETRAGLETDHAGRQARERFNENFKTI